MKNPKIKAFKESGEFINGVDLSAKEKEKIINEQKAKNLTDFKTTEEFTKGIELSDTEKADAMLEGKNEALAKAREEGKKKAQEKSFWGYESTDMTNAREEGKKDALNEAREQGKIQASEEELKAARDAGKKAQLEEAEKGATVDPADLEAAILRGKEAKLDQAEQSATVNQKELDDAIAKGKQKALDKAFQEGLEDAKNDLADAKQKGLESALSGATQEGIDSAFKAKAEQLEKDLLNAEDHYNDQLNTLETKLKEAENQVSEGNNALSKLNGQTEQLEKDLVNAEDYYNDQLNALEAKLKDVETNAKNYFEKINELNSEKIQHDTTLAKAQGDYAKSQQEAVEALDGARKNFDSKVKDLQEQLVKAQAFEQDLLNAEDYYQGVIKQLRNEIEKMKSAANKPKSNADEGRGTEPTITVSPSKLEQDRADAEKKFDTIINKYPLVKQFFATEPEDVFINTSAYKSLMPNPLPKGYHSTFLNSSGQTWVYDSVEYYKSLTAQIQQFAQGNEDAVQKEFTAFTKEILGSKDSPSVSYGTLLKDLNLGNENWWKQDCNGQLCGDRWKGLQQLVGRAYTVTRADLETPQQKKDKLAQYEKVSLENHKAIENERKTAEVKMQGLWNKYPLVKQFWDEYKPEDSYWAHHTTKRDELESFQKDHPGFHLSYNSPESETSLYWIGAFAEDLAQDLAKFSKGRNEEEVRKQFLGFSRAVLGFHDAWNEKSSRSAAYSYYAALEMRLNLRGGAWWGQKCDEDYCGDKWQGLQQLLGRAYTIMHAAINTPLDRTWGVLVDAQVCDQVKATLSIEDDYFKYGRFSNVTAFTSSGYYRDEKFDDAITNWSASGNVLLRWATSWYYRYKISSELRLFINQVLNIDEPSPSKLQVIRALKKWEDDMKLLLQRGSHCDKQAELKVWRDKVVQLVNASVDSKYVGLPDN